MFGPKNAAHATRGGLRAHHWHHMQEGGHIIHWAQWMAGVFEFGVLCLLVACFVSQLIGQKKKTVSRQEHSSYSCGPRLRYGRKKTMAFWKQKHLNFASLQEYVSVLCFGRFWLHLHGSDNWRQHQWRSNLHRRQVIARHAAFICLGYPSTPCCQSHVAVRKVRV